MRISIARIYSIVYKGVRIRHPFASGVLIRLQGCYSRPAHNDFLQRGVPFQFSRKSAGQLALKAIDSTRIKFSWLRCTKFDFNFICSCFVLFSVKFYENSSDIWCAFMKIEIAYDIEREYSEQWLLCEANCFYKRTLNWKNNKNSLSIFHFINVIGIH